MVAHRRTGVRVSEQEFVPSYTATCEIPEERRMPEARHCRHCLGDCPGSCLIGQPGRCIHGWNGKHPRQFRWQLLLTRRWWDRVLRGVR